MAEFKKECKVCGKEFISKQKNYKCCSKECMKINQRNHQRDNREKYNGYAKTWYYKHHKNKIAICHICGDKIEGHSAIKQYHDECVLRKAHETLMSGASHEHPDIRRARNFGFILREIAEGVN